MSENFQFLLASAECSSAGHWRTDSAECISAVQGDKCSQTKKDSWLQLFAKIPTCFYNLAKTYWYFLIPCPSTLPSVHWAHWTPQITLVAWGSDWRQGHITILTIFVHSIIVLLHCSRAWQTRALEQDGSFLVSFLTECFYRYHLSIKLFSFRNIGATSRLNIFFLV